MDKPDWKNRRSYHKVSGERLKYSMPRPRSRSSILMFSVGLMIAILVLNSGLIRDSTVPPQVKEMHATDFATVVGNFAANQWSGETLEMLEELVVYHTVQGNKEAVIYFELLRSGETAEAADELLHKAWQQAGKSRGTPAQSELDLMRKALKNAYNAKQAVLFPASLAIHTVFDFYSSTIPKNLAFSEVSACRQNLVYKLSATPAGGLSARKLAQRAAGNPWFPHTRPPPLGVFIFGLQPECFYFSSKSSQLVDKSI